MRSSRFAPYGFAIPAKYGYSASALLLSLACVAIIILFTGYSPLEIYQLIFIHTLNNKSRIFLALSQATPLIFTGMAFAIAYRVKIINLGGEGQLHIGGMAAAVIGAYVTGLGHVSHVFLSLAAGALAGAFVAFLIGIIKNKLGTSEVITSILFNSIIVYFTSFLCNGPLKPAGSATAQTKAVQATARLTKLVPKSQFTTAFIIAIGIAMVLYFLLNRTTLGYEMKAVGHNAVASQVQGINVSRVYLFTIMISGAIAGLCGAILVLGVNGRYVEDLSLNYGFAGLSVAALASYEPLATIVSAIVFGILKAGSFAVDRTTSIPVELVSVVQAFVVVFIAAPRMMDRLFDLMRSIFNLKKWRTKRI